MDESRHLINQQLWEAVKEGNQRAVERLLKDKGDPNFKSTYDYGSRDTSLLIVAADRNRQSIVQLFLKHGARINDSNSFGLTALHYASRNYHYEIVQQLIKSGANVDAVSVYGRSSLHFAAERGHDRVVQLLIESKAKIDLQNNRGRSSLHLAAESGHDRVVQLLIESKAKIDLQDNNGLRAEQVAKKRAKKVIVDFLKFTALYVQGTVSPKVMKLCVIGAAGAGKTTLLETLRRNFMKWLFTREKQEDDPTREYERTVGISVSTVDIPGVGRMSVYDHAGQKQFHKTHGLFFKASNAIFLLLVSLIRGGHIRTIEELIEEAQYWLAFLRASLEEECIPKVIIAASRADGYPEGGKLLRRVVSEMQRLFDGKVAITYESFMLDCRKSRSPEMKSLRVFLEKTRKEYLQQTTVRYPRLCEPVTSRLLPDLRRKVEEPFIETQTLVNEIEKRECPGQTTEVLDKVVDFLDETGETTVTPST